MNKAVVQDRFINSLRPMPGGKIRFSKPIKCRQDWNHPDADSLQTLNQNLEGII